MILNRKIVKDLRETLQSHLLKNMDEFEISVGNADDLSDKILCKHLTAAPKIIKCSASNGKY